jgi:putative membrane protein
METKQSSIAMPAVDSETKRKSYLRLFLSGFGMGMADVVPGVSGGTIAFIVGIYEELIQSINSIGLDFFRNLFRFRLRQAFDTPYWRFLITVGAGIITAILTFARALIWGMEHYPVLIWSFFFGLVLASVFVVAKRMKQWTAGKVAIAIFSAAAAYLLFGMMPVETPTSAWFIFLSGAVSITAMILPGISGAFILLILGKYEYLLHSLVTGNFLPLIFAGAGAAVGLLSFVRLLRILLLRYHDLTVAALIGLVAGALRKVWPWKEIPVDAPVITGREAALYEINVIPSQLTPEVGIAIGLIIFGFCVVFLLDYLGDR